VAERELSSGFAEDIKRVPFGRKIDF